jgi:hypothetical protein
MHKSFILLFSILLAFGACQKDPKTYSINGNVSKAKTADQVGGAVVYIDAKMIVDGVYNSNFVNITRATTDDQGNFSLSINEEKVASYRFRISKEGYFDYEEEVSVELLQAEESFEKNFSIIAESSIELRIKNTSPQGLDDEIDYRFENIEVSGLNCCNNETTIGIGPSFDTTSSCKVQNDEWIRLSWVVKKNGGQHIYNDSIFSVAGQTIIYHINY